ncbi:heavy metal-binding domain-containing protein [Candidatus Woesearchaeota archaeon]|nr:heavy metal-binding domain-containing protein [Candidatus Woesearchaeota archaeon]
MFLSTTESITGYKIIKNLGIVRGNSVRAKWFGADFVAGLKNIVGGEVEQYMKLMSEAREKAIERMNNDAKKLGANAVVCVRFMTSQIAQGAAEILVYGTAVQVKQ